jgi:hypothetical protein
MPVLDPLLDDSAFGLETAKALVEIDKLHYQLTVVLLDKGDQCGLPA